MDLCRYEETIRLLEDRVLALKRFEERRAEIEAEHKKALQEAEAEKQRAREMVRSREGGRGSRLAGWQGA